MSEATKQDLHFRALERMYLAAPVNRFYKPSITIGAESARIEIEVGEHLFHAAGAAHGSVYFKMLDDAAFFAANALERETFVLTASFTTYLTRPLTGGRIHSIGRVTNQTRTQFIAEATLYDEYGKPAGMGNGLFVRGRQRLVDTPGYDLLP